MARITTCSLQVMSRPSVLTVRLSVVLKRGAGGGGSSSISQHHDAASLTRVPQASSSLQAHTHAQLRFVQRLPPGIERARDPRGGASGGELLPPSGGPTQVGTTPGVGFRAVVGPESSVDIAVVL
jgi:hypothetical protein